MLYRGGKNSVREKLCPGEILPGKILSHPAGSVKYIDRREAPEIFEGNFACNWSLFVGKIQQSLSWLGKILSQPLKRPEKYCPKILDRVFTTRVFPGRSFPPPAKVIIAIIDKGQKHWVQNYNFLWRTNFEVGVTRADPFFD